MQPKQFLELSTEKITTELKNNPELLNWKDPYGNNILAYAAVYGKKDKLIFLLDNYPELNAHPDGFTLFHYAADYGQLEIVEYLLERFPDEKNKRHDKKVTPIFYAARSGNVEVFEFFIKNLGERINFVQSFEETGHSILYWGCNSGNKTMIRHLIMCYPEEMATLWDKDQFGDCVDTLKCAFRNRAAGNTLRPIEILHEMFDEIFKKDILSEEDLKILNAFEHTKLTEYLSKRPKFEEQFKIIKMNLKLTEETEATSPPADSQTSDDKYFLNLRTAEDFLNRSNEEITRAFEAKKMIEELDKDGGNILHYAITLGNTQKFLFLFNHYPQFDTQPRGRTLLHYAADNNALEIAAFLLKDRDAQNGCTIYGNTPTHFAAKHSSVEMVEALVKRFGLETRCNNINENILHWAAASGNNEMIRYLLITHPAEMAHMWTQNENGTPDDVVLNINNGATLPTEILFGIFDEILDRLKNGLTAEDAKILTAFKTNLARYFSLLSDDKFARIPLHRIYDFIPAETLPLIIAKQVKTQPLQKSHFKGLLIALEKSSSSYQFFPFNSHLFQSELYQQLRALHKNFIDNEYLVVQSLTVIVQVFYAQHGFDSNNLVIEAIEKIISAKRENRFTDYRFDVLNTFGNNQINLEEYVNKYYAYYQLIKPDEHLDESPQAIKKWIVQRFKEVDKNSLDKFLEKNHPQTRPFHSRSINGTN